MIAEQATREQTRARYPDEEGYIERDGVRIYYEVYGSGEPTILLLPTWSIIHSRHWKAQIPYLARHFRVLTLDGRGNGKSGRPDAPEAYAEPEFAADALAVLDATGTEQAVLVSLSAGAVWSTILAAEQPERVTGMVCIAPAAPFASHARRDLHPFDEALAGVGLLTETELPLHDVEGWAKWNRHYWREHYPDFLEFFFGQCFTEPHSTKQIEDTVGWGLETDPETLAATVLGWTALKNDPDVFRSLCRRVRCPVLVVHGTEDAIRPHKAGEEMARATGGEVVLLEGSGHLPHARDPAQVNLLIREFVERLP